MAHLEGEAAGAEAEVVTTAPDTQGADTPPTDHTTGEPDFYEDGDPFEDPEAEEDQAGEEGEEPVEAPVSLKAEEKEKFSQLPREAQQALSEIIQRREQDAQKGVESAQTAQRQAQAEAADKVAEAQRDFAQRFATVLSHFAPQPPPAELARSNTAEYLYRDAIFKQEQAAFQNLIGGIEDLQNQSTAHFEGRQEEWTDEQLNQLKSIPEYANEATRGQWGADIQNVGVELGYSEDALGQVNAQDVLALNRARAWKAKAEKWDAHQKKRNERPRAAQGRFAAAPAGARATGPVSQNDTLKTLYPND